jgi:hypothetical protein
MNEYDVIVIGGAPPANIAPVRWLKVACSYAAPASTRGRSLASISH